ncbi:MAG: drug resistance transporter [Ilumatobacteraceae bacterium]|nr:drug resistance transporter [Ilumatobacteraceae bacterium]
MSNRPTFTAERPLEEPLDPHVHARRWFTLVTLCISLLIIVMDNTILNVAIPKLIDELHATNSQVQWIVDGYTLVFAGLLLTTGSLGDRFGRKRALRLGITVFAIGSALSALSGSPSQLIAARCLMGVGGAMIMPSTLSILTNVFRDPKERGRAIAVWAGFSGLGVAIGPVIGGLLLNHYSWASVFWVNVPIAAIALVLGFFFVPESRDPSAPRLDPLGAALSIVGLGALLFGIIEGPTQGWRSTEVVIAFVVGVIGVVSFILWERHTDHPMLDMSFFKNPRFTAANTAITLTFFAMFGAMFLMTQYWQFVHGYSPLAAGVKLIPFAVVMMVVAPLSARFVEILGTKMIVTLGLSIVATSLLLLSLVKRDSSYYEVIGFMCILAAGMGLVMAPATESVMGSLPREKAGVGSAVNDTTRQMGGALGVAIIGTFVASVYSSGIGKIATEFGLTSSQVTSAKGSLGSALTIAADPNSGITNPARFVDRASDYFVDGLTSGMRVGAVFVIIAAIVAFRYLPAFAKDPLAHHELPDNVVLTDAETAVEPAPVAGN